MFYIGIDLGTSAVKLLLTDERGKILRIVSKEYPLDFPRPGWAEQDPADWISAVMSGLKELTELTDTGKIAGIGVGGQMHGLVVLDEEDRVIRPAILWNDGRTQAETDQLNTAVGKERLSELTGNIAFAGFTAPKLLWMRKNEPEAFGRIARIMLPKDYVNYILTGMHATDLSDASGTLLLDVRNRRWSREMLEICGVSEKQMPKLYESYECIGTLKPEIAGELGLPVSVRVSAGAGDNAAAAVGTGTVGEGRCNISLGTSGTIFISGRQFRMDHANALHAFAHADGGYHLMGCMLSAASCNKWWFENILRKTDFEAGQSEIPEGLPGRNHVYFLPYLMGERAPHNDASARSCFIGMTMDTSRADLTLAVMEGVAFGLRDSLEAARNCGVDVKTSMLCGGGAKSRLWRKILASVLDMELTVPATEQGPGYGGAILAAVSCGEFASVEEAAEEWVRIREAILPDTGLAALYEERYRVYKKLYPALKEVFPEL